MDEILQSKRKRFLFLKTLYTESGGNELASFNMFDIGKHLGFNREETQNIAHYLNGEGLIKFFELGGGIVITHFGIVEIEKVLSEPEKSTTYFPPLNIINIHHMENSQIQQGNVKSKQIIDLTIENIKGFHDFLETLKQRQNELNLNINALKELNAEISTVESQLNSSRPKKNILLESLESLKSILESATGSMLASELLLKIPYLLSLL